MPADDFRDVAEKLSCSDGGDAVKVSIERRGNIEPTSVQGELVELRRGGAKVLVPVLLKFAEAVRVQVVAPQLNIDLVTEAQICRIGEGEDGKWIAHCSFPSEVSERLQPALAKSGQLNRRQGLRHHCCIPGLAIWQLDNHQVRGEVRDYSAGGFRFVAPTVGEFGSHLLLELDSRRQSDAVRGKVLWQLSANDETVVGCAFVDREDFHRIKAAAEEHQAKNAESDLMSHRAGRAGSRGTTSTPVRRLFRSNWAMRIAVVLLILMVVRLAPRRPEPSTCPGPEEPNKQRPVALGECAWSPPQKERAPSNRTNGQENKSQPASPDEPDNDGGAHAAHDLSDPVSALDRLETPPSAPEPVGSQQKLDRRPDVAQPSQTLVLRNPLDNGAHIYYIINGEVRSLGPGQSHRFDGRTSWQIQFHRGGEYGDVKRQLHPETHEFRPGKRGWELVEIIQDLG